MIEAALLSGGGNYRKPLIAYISAGNSRLYVHDCETEEVTEFDLQAVTQFTRSSPGLVQFSPSGKYLVVVTTKAGTTYITQFGAIYQIDDRKATYLGSRTVVSGSSSNHTGVGSIKFSPDETRVAFCSSNTILWLSVQDPSNSSFAGQYSVPTAFEICWSQNRRYIYFMQQARGALQAIDINTKTLTGIDSVSGNLIRSPVLHPVTGKVLYRRNNSSYGILEPNALTTGSFVSNSTPVGYSDVMGGFLPFMVDGLYTLPGSNNNTYLEYALGWDGERGLVPYRDPDVNLANLITSNNTMQRDWHLYWNRTFAAFYDRSKSVGARLEATPVANYPEYRAILAAIPDLASTGTDTAAKPIAIQPQFTITGTPL